MRSNPGFGDSVLKFIYAIDRSVICPANGLVGLRRSSVDVLGNRTRDRLFALFDLLEILMVVILGVNLCLLENSTAHRACFSRVIVPAWCTKPS